MAQTILTVPLDRPMTARPGDENYQHVTRRAYSIDGYSPVLVTIKVGTTTAIVHTTSLPGGGWWREPNAATRRMLLDHELFKRRMVRVPGSRCETPSADQWYHTYEVRALRTPMPTCPSRDRLHDEHVFTHMGRVDDPSFGARVDCAGR